MHFSEDISHYSRMWKIQFPVFYFLCLVLRLCCVQSEEDFSDWVDPSDMLTYDPITKTNKRFDLGMVCDCGKKSDDTGLSSERCDNAIEYRKKYEDCEKRSKTSELCESGDKKSAVESTYMQRFIAILLQHFNSESAMEVQNYQVTVKLNSANRRKLEEFVESKKVHLNEIDLILTELIVDSEPVTENGSTVWLSSLDERTRILLFWFALAVAGLVMLYSLIRVPYHYIFFVLFFVGTFWHWQHMYQQTIAERHAELTKNPEMPTRCLPQRMSWIDGLKAWWSEDVWKGEDECKKYFKTLMVDPIWDVSPTMAFSYMFTQFVTYPLAVLGTNVGTFFGNLNAALPPFTIFLVLPFILVVIGFALFMVFGYSIRGFGWHIGPANQPQVMASQLRPMVEELHETRKSIEMLKKHTNDAVLNSRDISEPKALITTGDVRVNQHSGVEELERLKTCAEPAKNGAGDDEQTKKQPAQVCKLSEKGDLLT